MASKTTKSKLPYFCIGLTGSGLGCRTRVATEGAMCDRGHEFTALDTVEVAALTVIGGWDTAVVETSDRPAAIVEGTGYHEDGAIDVFGVRALEQAILAEGDVHPDRLERVKVVQELLAAGHADKTRTGYEANVGQFREFCQANGLVEFPASVATVADWLGELALWRNPITGKPYQTGTIAAKLSAVSTWHKSNGKPNPVTAELLTLIRKGFARRHGRPPAPADAVLMEGLVAMVEVTLAPSHTAVRKAVMLMLLTDPVLGLGPRALERFRSWHQVRWPKGKRTVAELELPYGKGMRIFEIHGHEDPDLDPLRALRDLYEASEHLGAPFPNAKDGRPMTAGGIVRLAKDACERALVFPDRTYWLDDDERRRLIAAVLAPTDLQVRDRVLMILDWWCATRRSEVAALCWRDVTMPGRGSNLLAVVIGRSKTDQRRLGKVRQIHSQPDARVDPAPAVEEWKLRLERLLGRPVEPDDPVFVRLDRAGRLVAGAARAMSGDAVNERVKVLAAEARVTGKITSHSMRAGMITNQIIAGKNVVAVAEHVGHASLETTHKYVRAAAGFGDLNATRPQDPKKRPKR